MLQILSLNQSYIRKTVCEFRGYCLSKSGLFSDEVQSTAAGRTFSGYPLITLERHCTTCEFSAQSVFTTSVGTCAGNRTFSNDLLIDFARIGLGMPVCRIIVSGKTMKILKSLRRKRQCRQTDRGFGGSDAARSIRQAFSGLATISVTSCLSFKEQMEKLNAGAGFPIFAAPLIRPLPRTRNENGCCSITLTRSDYARFDNGNPSTAAALEFFIFVHLRAGTALPAYTN